MISIEQKDINNMKVKEIEGFICNIFEMEDNFDYDLLINLLKKDDRKTVRKLADKIYKILTNRKKEINRVKKMYDFDKSFKVNSYIAGADEVGRGPLAGPIVAASVVLDLNYKYDKDLILGINDSKKISPKVREELDLLIKKRAISYCIAKVDNKEIDKRGIAWCNNEVLRKSVYGLNSNLGLVLSDGYFIKNCKMRNEYVIKGDSKSASIACASIIAKVYRDNIMKQYCKIYPQYGFENNVGYGTKEHIMAIKKYGSTPIHRKSFLKNILVD